MCDQSGGKLYGFATLPVRNTAACLKEIDRLKKLPHVRGVILGRYLMTCTSFVHYYTDMSMPDSYFVVVVVVVVPYTHRHPGCWERD